MRTKISIFSKTVKSFIQEMYSRMCKIIAISKKSLFSFKSKNIDENIAHVNHTHSICTLKMLRKTVVIGL